MTCEHTGKSEVIRVRHTAKGTRRRRVCLDCGERYTTLETVVTHRKPSAAPDQRGFALAGWLR